jgi:uncharacterized protein YkwD
VHVHRLIAVLSAFVVLVSTGVAQAASCPGADDQPTPETLVAAVQTTICLVNDQRAAAGVQPVTLELGLTAVAFGYARDMVDEQFYAHMSPDGAILADRLARIGYHPYAAGENLYWGMSDLDTPAEAVQGWLDSPEHRRNLIDPLYSRIGVGISIGDPMGFSGPAATYVSEYDSGPGSTAPDGTPTAPDVTDVIDANPPTQAAVELTLHRRAAASVRRAVRDWIDANRTGDSHGFCLLEDNRMLGAQFGATASAGRAACRARFRMVAGLPLRTGVGFSSVRLSGTSARATILVHGIQGVIALRKFNGHWKLDAVGA